MRAITDIAATMDTRRGLGHAYVALEREEAREVIKALRALAELVTCKDLKEQAEDACADVLVREQALAEYKRRQPLAWAAARAVTKGTP